MSILLNSESIDAAFERMVATNKGYQAAPDSAMRGQADAYQHSALFQLSLSALGREIMQRIRESIEKKEDDATLVNVYRSFEALGIMFFEAGYHAALNEFEKSRMAS